MDATLVSLDSGNVTVAFAVRWFGLVQVRGTFGRISGAARRTTPHVIDVAVEVASDSVRTGISLRDTHLRGPRFLNAARYPRILFRGRVTAARGGARQIDGTLTLSGVDRVLSLTCPVEMQADHVGAVPVTASFTVSREDHDIGTVTGFSHLSPLLWAIAAEVTVTVTIMVPAALLQPDPLLARAH